MRYLSHEIAKYYFSVQKFMSTVHLSSIHCILSFWWWHEKTSWCRARLQWGGSFGALPAKEIFSQTLMRKKNLWEKRHVTSNPRLFISIFPPELFLGDDDGTIVEGRAWMNLVVNDPTRTPPCTVRFLTTSSPQLSFSPPPSGEDALHYGEIFVKVCGRMWSNTLRLFLLVFIMWFTFVGSSSSRDWLHCTDYC